MDPLCSFLSLPSLPLRDHARQRPRVSLYGNPTLRTMKMKPKRRRRRRKGGEARIHPRPRCPPPPPNQAMSPPSKQDFRAFSKRYPESLLDHEEEDGPCVCVKMGEGVVSFHISCLSFPLSLSRSSSPWSLDQETRIKKKG